MRKALEGIAKERLHGREVLVREVLDAPVLLSREGLEELGCGPGEALGEDCPKLDRRIRQSEDLDLRDCRDLVALGGRQEGQGSDGRAAGPRDGSSETEDHVAGGARSYEDQEIREVAKIDQPARMAREEFRSGREDDGSRQPRGSHPRDGMPLLDRGFLPAGERFRGRACPRRPREKRNGTNPWGEPRR